MTTDPIIISVEDPAVRDLLPRYLERRRLDVDTLRSLHASGELEPVAHMGHRMRGSGAAYGIPEITAIGTDIDRAARAGDTEAVIAAIDRLAAFVERAQIG